MIYVFKRMVTRQTKSAMYISLKDVEASTVQRWNQHFLRTGLTASSAKLLVRESLQERQRTVNQARRLVRCVREEAECSIQGNKPEHLFILTDLNGKVLDVIGEDEAVRQLESHNVGAGTSMSQEHAGINAISVCMELGQPVVVEGCDHHLHMFSEWTCVCAPIRINNRIVGYLDLSFASGTNPDFASLLLHYVIRKVEQQLADLTKRTSSQPASVQGQPLRQRVEESFTVYGLTPREQEVAYRWLINQTTAQIAAELYITEGTIRNMLKRIYSKVEVNGRGMFMNKFLGTVD